MSTTDRHIRVLPLHVANKIAAGEVVERPASVVKELVENSIDAGATKITVSIREGGRKLISVTDNGIGMTRDDAVLSLERQATSKILDVEDIEKIETLGFRGEAIPSIASVSRFSITTRRHDSDEGVFVKVDAGTLSEVSSVGCPPGTIVEVKDIFCNVPVRRKFLRSAATEETHIKSIFTNHALSFPSISFILIIDGKEVYNLAQAKSPAQRMADILGEEASANMLPLEWKDNESGIEVRGFIEKPNLTFPTRKDQHIFINSRAASAPCIAYAIKDAYPKSASDSKPALVLFLNVPPQSVDVNVHPMKREVRFRNTSHVKLAVSAAIEKALEASFKKHVDSIQEDIAAPAEPRIFSTEREIAARPVPQKNVYEQKNTPLPCPLPTQRELKVEEEKVVVTDANEKKGVFNEFSYLGQTRTGFIIAESDDGLVTINPKAARERIAYEKIAYADNSPQTSQSLLIPETIHLAPSDAMRLRSYIEVIRKAGFAVEEFGSDTFKFDAVPQIMIDLPLSSVITTLSRDIAENHGVRNTDKLKNDIIAKSIAKSFAGMSKKMDAPEATRLIEELCKCRMPYICPRGKPVMIFTSTRELCRKFGDISLT
jgi:DNA mismatch repair protein MutL